MAEIKEIEKLQKIVNSAEKNLRAIKDLDFTLYGEEGKFNYYMSLVKSLEDATILARKLPCIPQLKHEIGNEMITPSETVEFETIGNEIERITLPRLLPARKYRRDNNYLNELYAPQIYKHYKLAKYPEGKKIVWFIHCYKKKKRGFRDHDNIETKCVLDMIAPYLLIDDSPVHCEIHESSEESCEDKTEIYIIPAEEFSDFYARRLTRSK